MPVQYKIMAELHPHQEYLSQHRHFHIELLFTYEEKINLMMREIFTKTDHLQKKLFWKVNC